MFLVKDKVLYKKTSQKKLRKVSIIKRLLMSFITLSIVPIFIVINTTSIDLIEKNIISNDKIASNLIVQVIGGYMDKFDSTIT